VPTRLNVERKIKKSPGLRKQGVAQRRWYAVPDEVEETMGTATRVERLRRFITGTRLAPQDGAQVNDRQ
jgi:hypothetical protein